MVKKLSKFIKNNHTCRWYDDTQPCKTSCPNSTSFVKYTNNNFQARNQSRWFVRNPCKITVFTKVRFPPNMDGLDLIKTESFLQLRSQCKIKLHWSTTLGFLAILHLSYIWRHLLLQKTPSPWKFIRSGHENRSFYQQKTLQSNLQTVCYFAPCTCKIILVTSYNSTRALCFH